MHLNLYFLTEAQGGLLGERS